jgi:two-component system, NtrC family, response regulator PilR
MNAAVFFEASERKVEDMASVNQVLVISPEKEHHEKITAAMNKCGVLSVCCMKFDEARIFMDKEKFEVVFCHETLPDGDFRGVVSAAKPTPVVVLSRFAEWDHYLAALRAGAFDYIACPPDSAETERIVWSAIGNSRGVAAGDAVH